MSSIERAGVGGVGSAFASAPLTMIRRSLEAARAVLGWAARVHANRKLLHAMAGMSAHELADIGLTPADLRDTAALSLDGDIGHFLSTRAIGHRRYAMSRRATRSGR